MSNAQIYGGGSSNDDEEEFSSGGGQTQVNAIDSILDEIDSVLETNAETFVQGFVQKGGE